MSVLRRWFLVSHLEWTETYDNFNRSCSPGMVDSAWRGCCIPLTLCLIFPLGRICAQRVFWLLFRDARLSLWITEEIYLLNSRSVFKGSGAWCHTRVVLSISYWTYSCFFQRMLQTSELPHELTERVRVKSHTDFQWNVLWHLQEGRSISAKLH